MGQQDSLILRHSLVRQAASRLVFSLGLVVLVVGISSIFLYQRTLAKAGVERDNQLREFYAARLAQLEREWELHARSYRVLIEYTRQLEDPENGEVGLQAFLTIQGGDRRFQHMIVVDRAGAPRFQFGKTQNLATFPIPLDHESGWYQAPESRQLYRVFADRIWLGKEGVGRVGMMFAVDNALLGQLSAPGVSLLALFAGIPVASSDGSGSLLQPDDLDLLAGLPWDGKEGSPLKLAIKAPVRPIFSLQELAVGVSSIPILDGLILWFGLGVWILLHTRRLRRLGEAVRSFSASGAVTPEFLIAIGAAKGEDHDEIGDLAATMQAMAEAREQEEAQRRLMSLVFDNSSEAIIICDATNRILAANRSFTRLTGYLPEEVIGQDPKLLSAGLEEPAFYTAMWDSIHSTGQWRGEIRDRRKDGTIYPKWLSIDAIRNSHGELTHYVGMFTDITQLKVEEQRLTHLATHDTLTGLPNRQLLIDRLDGAIALARREGLSLAVLFLDLDRFKWVNDTLGHAAGDRLLMATAKRLQDSVRESDTVARLGGDEFVLMLQGHGSAANIGQVAQKLIRAIAQPVEIQDQRLRVTTSVGISLFPKDGDTPEALLQRADAAMYAAKGAGRNQWRLFDSDVKEVPSLEVQG